MELKATLSAGVKNPRLEFRIPTVTLVGIQVCLS